MASIEPGALLDFASTLKTDERKTGGAKLATVVRVDGEQAYVKIPGGVEETPVATSGSVLSVGDIVSVSVQNGKLRAAANVTNPSAGILRMQATERVASTAYETSVRASEAADFAEAEAVRAGIAADSAQASATTAYNAAMDAQHSATNANEYASRALGNLSTVQSVAETLTWITQHGTMTLTADTTPDPSHVYFVRDANGDYTVGSYHYSIVAEPVQANMGSYYELSIDESLNNYVGTHLALTGDGLWMLPASTGTYKVLVATGAGSTYTEPGTYIIDSTGGTVAYYGDSVQIGDVLESHVLIDFHSLQLIDKEGNTYLDVEDLRGADGRYQALDVFQGDGTTKTFTLTYTATNNTYTVVNTGGANPSSKTTTSFTFATAPAVGDTINATYYTESTLAKGFTFGTRSAASSIGSYSATFGRSVKASGAESFATGHSSAATGKYSFATGETSAANGYCSHVQNAQTTASGYYSSAAGHGSTASGYASFATGNGTTASGASSFTCGQDTVAAYGTQVAIGINNDNKSTNLFEIGNGGALTYSNAFEVSRTGNTTCAGDLSAVNATFSGNVSAVGGTFTGGVSADDLTASTITLAGHSTAVGSQLSTSISSAKNVGSNTVELGSIELPTGTWLLMAHVQFSNNTTGYREISLSTTSAAIGETYDHMSFAKSQAPSGGNAVLNCHDVVVNSSSSNVAYYLNVWQNSGSTLTATGKILATRLV